MDWTLSQIRTKFRQVTGQLSTSQLSNDDVDEKINDFYLNVFPGEVQASELKGFYSFNTIDGTGEYTKPSTVFDINRPLTIDDGDGDAVGKLGLWRNKEDFFDLYPEDDSADENTPVDMLLYGNTFYLRPIPDDVYTIKMAAVQKPTELSADDSVPTNPKWGPVIAYGAAIQMLTEQKDWDAVEKYTSVYQFYLNLVNRDDLAQRSNLRSRPSF